jgi:hypothetical protein
MFDNNKNTNGDERIAWKTLMRAFYNWNNAEKVLDARYWWPIMYRDVHDYCKSCDACQRIRGLTTQSLTKLVINLLEEPFMKWRFDFVGPIKPTRIYT